MESLEQMGRPALQALAKRHGIKANRKSEAIISELRPLIAAGDICESAFSDLIRFEDESAYNPPDVKEASGPSAEPLTKGKSESASESQESSDVARLEPSISKHPESERSLANTNAMEQSGSADAQPSLELVRSSEAGARSSKAVAAVPSSGTAHPSVNDASASPAVKQRPKSYVKGAHSAKKVKKEAPLPRVASLTQSPAPKSVVSTGSNDRFKEMYQVRSGPSATSYNAAFKSTFASSAMPFNSGIPDRFAGHDSRYRKGLRQSTASIHDPEVYRAKPVDENVPLPHVAEIAPRVEKPSVQPSNERFAGPDSIYSVPETPAPTTYNTSGGESFGSRSLLVPSFDKSSAERFAGQQSIYSAPDTPAPTAYNPADEVTSSSSLHAPSFNKSSSERFVGPTSIYFAPETPSPAAYNSNTGEEIGSQSVLVPSFEKSLAERFSGPDSIYRKGLRQSTIPTQQCNDLQPRPTINKSSTGWGASSKRGASLKAALKASLLGSVVE